MNTPIPLMILDPMHSAIERVLPGVMFMVLHESMTRKGMEIREDIVTFAQRATQAQMLEKDAFTISRILKKANEVAGDLLRATNADRIEQTWVAAAHAVLKAKTRGVEFDSNLVLLALGVETEMLENAEDYGGAKVIDDMANRIDNKALELGFWKERDPASTALVI